jgi:glucokinase
MRRARHAARPFLASRSWRSPAAGRIRVVERRADRPILAIDLGGTQIRAALVTSDRVVHRRRAVPTADEEGVEAVLDRIVEVASAVRRQAAADGLPEPIGVGISSPGPLDPWRGVVRLAPNLEGWRDIPLGPRVAAGLDLGTFLERDTNVAIMGEWRYGAAVGTQNAIYLTLSTGLGGAAIVDGRPLVGTSGTAGEFGHITVDLDGPRCGCGGMGHVESIASGTALANFGRALAAEQPDSPLARLAADGAEIDARLVALAAEQGDAGAATLLERAWVAFGALCASLVNALDPEVIVIGGSIAEHHQAALFDQIAIEMERRAFPILLDKVRIVPAALGGDVSLIGSLPIVNERIDDPAYAVVSIQSQQGASIS